MIKITHVTDGRTDRLTTCHGIPVPHSAYSRVVNEAYDVETEMRPRYWSDGIETRPRGSKNALRPSRDVRDRDYNLAA